MSTSTAEMVDRVLAAMGKASSGDPDAVVDAEETTPEPEVTPLSDDKQVYTRPNGTEYHVRKLGPHDDVAFLRRAREQMLPVLTTGRPGTGKTALIEAAFGDTGFYTVQGHGDTTVDDLVGSYVPISATEFEFKLGPLPLAMTEGVPLYVDEIAIIDPKVMAVAYAAIDGRGELEITQNPAVGTIKAQPGFYLVAACNPDAPGANMSEALLSRFPIQFETKTDYSLALKLGTPKKVVAAAQNLDVKLTEGVVSWAPQLRELLDVARVSDQFGLDFALSNLIAIAPPMDRDTVQDVLERALGREIKPLALS